MTYAESIKKLTLQYNDAIRALQSSYDLEKAQQGWLQNLTGTSLKRNYSTRYEVLAGEYRAKCRQILAAEKVAHPAWAKGRTMVGVLLVVSIILMFICCGASMDKIESSPSAVMSNTTEKRYWNAENIPIPHLQDATQYVSNPDNILTQQAVDRMNVTLKRMDDSLGVESVVIVVGHIENDDPFRMAQDVGNRYGVGREDRGLVIVVGYEDHSINISPGRSLEGNLTDAECHRLEQQYVVPAMRAEMPDSGMIYLTDAIYSTLQKKQLPQMTRLSSHDDQLEEELTKIIGIYMLIFIGWLFVFYRMNRKYLWVDIISGISLMANPFAETNSGGGFFIGGGGGRSGGFGGGGGSFGGGSFGGGGATSRW